MSRKLRKSTKALTKYERNNFIPSKTPSKTNIIKHVKNKRIEESLESKKAAFDSMSALHLNSVSEFNMPDNSLQKREYYRLRKSEKKEDKHFAEKISKMMEPKFSRFMTGLMLTIFFLIILGILLLILWKAVEIF